MSELPTLEDLGWNATFQAAFDARGVDNNEIPARIVEEQRGAYFVQSTVGELLATISGRMRHEAHRREDFPAVGDWTAIKAVPEHKKATLQALLPRHSKLSRKASGQESDEQLIATNLDTVFIVTSLNKDFNARRIERYVAMVAESGAEPVVLLSKVDLASNTSEAIAELQKTIGDVRTFPISSTTGQGIEALAPYLQKAKTVALIGSSGVGKSTLINRLIGWERQKVQAVRETDDRGRHTTTCRRLIALPQGAMLIDTPGMRELQLWDSERVEETFDDIRLLMGSCKFRDCKHRTDAGCAVQVALKDGTLTRARYENYLKLRQEADQLAYQLEKDAENKANEKIKLARAAYKREPKD